MPSMPPSASSRGRSEVLHDPPVAAAWVTTKTPQRSAMGADKMHQRRAMGDDEVHRGSDMGADTSLFGLRAFNFALL